MTPQKSRDPVKQGGSADEDVVRLADLAPHEDAKGGTGHTPHIGHTGH